MSERDPFGPPDPAGPVLEAIIALAARATGIDFTAYKRSMLARRIGHRARLCGVALVDDYLQLVERDAAEQERLRSALLIQTTGAFRGERTFELLRARALPELVRARARPGPLRAWAAACSTGEEAWSLAMCLAETGLDFELIATDVDEGALARARLALLPPEAADDVPSELALAHLAPAAGGWRVDPELARRVRFVRHDALDRAQPVPRQAVLASFDLVSCRNLLIYLGPDAQEHVSRALVGACEPGGLVLLDESETPAPAVADSLVRIDARAGIWRRTS